MPKFKVTHSYRSNHNGRFYAFDEGAEVEVEADIATWVNRDSPGTLKPTGKAKADDGGAKSDAQGDQAPSGRPPEAGKGSGTKVWAKYATDVVGIEVHKGAKKAEIVAAVKAAEGD